MIHGSLIKIKNKVVPHYQHFSIHCYVAIGYIFTKYTLESECEKCNKKYMLIAILFSMNAYGHNSVYTTEYMILFFRTVYVWIKL